MRSHQNDAAALEQWKPLIHKMAFKAARRAAAIDVPMSHDDFVQELSITVLRCHDSFNPDLGVKMITFLYRAIYNELNKIFDRETAGRMVSIKSEPDTDADGNKIQLRDVRGDLVYNDDGTPAWKMRHRKVTGFKVSGDSTWTGEDGDSSAWDHIEDDIERSPEHAFMDAELVKWVHSNVDREASAVLSILQSGNPFVTQQLHAYNAGIEYDAATGGIKRVPLDINFSFVSKLLGHSPAKQAKLANQIKQAVAIYGT